MFILNESAYWRNVPEKVWDYTIGGYQVIKKWLSYREQSPCWAGRSRRTRPAKSPTWPAALPP